MHVTYSFIGRNKQLVNATIDNQMSDAEIAHSLREAVTVSAFPQAGESPDDAKATLTQVKTAYGYEGEVTAAGKSNGFYLRRKLPVASPVARILAAASA
jgi:hypothetical protein